MSNSRFCFSNRSRRFVLPGRSLYLCKLMVCGILLLMFNDLNWFKAIGSCDADRTDTDRPASTPVLGISKFCSELVAFRTLSNWSSGSCFVFRCEMGILDSKCLSNRDETLDDLPPWGPNLSSSIKSVICLLSALVFLPAVRAADVLNARILFMPVRYMVLTTGCDVVKNFPFFVVVFVWVRWCRNTVHLWFQLCFLLSTTFYSRL